MGGVILFGLFVLAIFALIRPALKARAQSQQEERRQSAHEEVVRRLDDHRPRPKDRIGKDEGGDDV